MPPESHRSSIREPQHCGVSTAETSKRWEREQLQWWVKGQARWSQSMSPQHNRNAKLSRCKASTTLCPWVASSANHSFPASPRAFKPWKLSMTKRDFWKLSTSMPTQNRRDMTFVKACSALKIAGWLLMVLLASQLMLFRDQCLVCGRMIVKNIFQRLKKKTKRSIPLGCLMMVYREQLQNITWKRISRWVPNSKDCTNGNALFRTLQSSQTTT